MWVRVSNLHFSDKMEILSPQREVAASFPIPCGCKFSNLHFPDTMKSCRHKRNDARLPPQGIEIALFHPMGHTLHEPKISQRFC